MKKEIILELQAQDFENTSFISCTNCAISRAAKRQEGFEEVAEGVNYLDIYKQATLYNLNNGRYLATYRHDEYELKDFYSDKEKAEGSGPQTVIRTLTLTLV